MLCCSVALSEYEFNSWNLGIEFSVRNVQFSYTSAVGLFSDVRPPWVVKFPITCGFQ